MLGGAEDRIVGAARGVPALNEAAEREVEAVDAFAPLPRRQDRVHRRRRGILYKSASEASGFASLLTAMGVAPDRLILEDKSRDTFENAAFLKAELGQQGLLGPGARWLLITSAYHMPRAMGVFRKAGFAVEPWPVDYRTRGPADLTRPFDKVSEGLRRVDIASREWVGLLAYWITGRSDALFPGPEPPAVCDLGDGASRQSASTPMSTQPLR